VRISWGKSTSRPFVQQPALASSIPYYPMGTYAPSAPLATYPAYSSPALDPYAAYHAMGQPGTDPYLVQAPTSSPFSIAVFDVQ
jgi:hypothetical protein